MNRNTVVGIVLFGGGFRENLIPGDNLCIKFKILKKLVGSSNKLFLFKKNTYHENKNQIDRDAF